MSTNAHSTETTVGADRFTRVGAPTRIDTTTLGRMAEPDDVSDVDETVRVFAIATVDGVVYNTTAQREYEATNVLFATADGERVAERWIAGGIEAAPRACIVDVDELDQTGPNARRLTSALAAHPEVSTRGE